MMIVNRMNNILDAEEYELVNEKLEKATIPLNFTKKILSITEKTFFHSELVDSLILIDNSDIPFSRQINHYTKMNPFIFL